LFNNNEIVCLFALFIFRFERTLFPHHYFFLIWKVKFSSWKKKVGKICSLYFLFSLSALLIFPHFEEKFVWQKVVFSRDVVLSLIKNLTVEWCSSIIIINGGLAK
jgi:hypothetical protein